MTAMNLFLRGDEAHLLYDSASYEPGTFKCLTIYSPKVIVHDTLPLAIGGSGQGGIAWLAPELLALPADLRSIRRAIPDVLRRRVEATGFQIALNAIAWNAETAMAEAWAIESEPSPELPPDVWQGPRREFPPYVVIVPKASPTHSVAPPLNGWSFDRLDTMDLHAEGAGLVAAQREVRAFVGPDGTRHAGIGGFVTMTTVSAEGVKHQTLADLGDQVEEDLMIAEALAGRLAPSHAAAILETARLRAEAQGITSARA